MGDNADQAAFWGGAAGDSWIAQQQLLDTLFAPVLNEVVALAGMSEGQHVLDVGCGTGQSAFVAATHVGPNGHVLGADISASMLGVAQKRAQGQDVVSVQCVDVAHHAFPPERFDHVISRFGVMFFDEPIAAFTNIARAMKTGAQLTFASWGQIERNPWFTLPARSAKAEIGTPPKSDPDAPGPFAFRDIAKVNAILRAAGFRDIKGVAQDMLFTLPGGAADMAHLASVIGPAERTATYFDSDETTRARLLDRLQEGFAAFPDDAVPAEINFFTARR